MKEMIMDSYAKINLALNVLDKRADGYHNIETIFQQIDLRDGMYLRIQPGGFQFSCDYRKLPTGEGNTIFTAWNLMKELYSGDPGVRVHLEKNIPIAAGLAGGSSNAATMIKALNELWELGLSVEEMCQIGIRIGADVPFFFYSNTAYGTGKGEELTPLKNFAGRKLLVVNTGYGVSTKSVYDNIDRAPTVDANFDALIQGIESENDELVYPHMVNRLEAVTTHFNPDISEIKMDMIRLGARSALMCGSGPTVFGIFDHVSKLENAFFYFKDKYNLVYVCETR
ncbi:MAG: 4-(cytidine 5'-diphospho)-2-C-methyl-D-erythritol kinase [Tissierellia bacterium]|nr:4-(cytidine 5'-diphospho)-2-C-methyl-D-erythritol kinase [Tissierellia bacterium]